MQKKSFSIYFDGTGNNLLGYPDCSLTNIGKLYKAQHALGTDLSYNNGNPNKYKNQFGVGYFSGQDEKIYFDGVGSTPKGTYLYLFQGITGQGGSSRINDAYEAMVIYHNKYPGEDININVLGFSRGASQARAFCNVAIERGVPKLDEQKRVTEDYLIEPGALQINKLAIFDTVASYGFGLSDAHPGKNLSIHPQIRSTTHLIALNEYRKVFPLTSALKEQGEPQNLQIEEIGFPGAHAQVGGGYKNDILAAGPLSFMYERLKDAGMKMDPLQEEDIQRIKKYNEIIVSPKTVVSHLVDSRLKSGDSGKSTFPLEKGWLDPWNAQSVPFEHSAHGRKLIYEFNDSLDRDFRIDDLLYSELIVKNYKERGAKFLAERNLEDSKITEKSFNTAYKKSRQPSPSFTERTLDKAMTKTGPTLEYISSFDFQPVPLATPNIDENNPYNRSLATSFVDNLKKSGHSEGNQNIRAKQEKFREWRESKGTELCFEVDQEGIGPKMS